MTLDAFAQRLGAKEPPLDAVGIALALLWWRERATPGAAMSAGDLSRDMSRLGLGAPHSTRLGERLSQSKLVLKAKGLFRLRADALSKIETTLAGVVEPQAPSVPSESEYLPEPVWRGTRGYIEVVCVQLNGCHFATFYDAASVMARRLVETLLIEAYEKLAREAEIKSDGTFLMLGDIIEHAVGATGLPLGRDSKKALRSVKELGDRSAHNRRFIARRHDMDALRSPLRVLADELIGIAELRRGDQEPPAA